MITLLPPGRRWQGAALAALAVLAFGVLAGCAGNPAIEASRKLLAAGDTDAAIERLADATRQSPDDTELRAIYHRQRELAASRLLAAADSARATDRNSEAEAIYRRVQRIDPANPRAVAGLAQIDADTRRAALVKEGEAALAKNNATLAERNARTVLAEVPGHAAARALMQAIQEEKAQAEARALTPKGPPPKPISMEFRDVQIKTVFEVLARSSGLNFVFDKDVRSDTKVTIFIRNSNVDEIVRLILATQQLDSKPLNENSLLIYPKTAAKAKEHQEMVVRSFFLANAEAKQAQMMLKNVLKVKDIFIDEKLGLLVVKDTAEVVKLAEHLIASLDLAEPEVMLDLEVLEISRNQLYELGISFPDQIGYGRITPDVSNKVTDTNGVTISQQTTFGGALAPGYIDLRSRSGLTTFTANPGLLLNLKSNGGDNNLLANPRIRVKNRDKAKIHIGDKLPVFTTTATANVGVAASVSYLDVGLKLDVEPIVHMQDEVEMKVGLEVSSVVKEIVGPSNSTAYQIGTRSATTTLRLKNGETQILAGLISNEERNSANKLPGLGDIPIFGRLFASNKDSSSKTEIVLLITPRIVRSLTPPQVSEPARAAGTEISVGAPALRLSPTAPRSLSMPARSGAAPAATGGERPATPMPPDAPTPSDTPEAPPPPANASDGRNDSNAQTGSAPPAAAPETTPASPSAPAGGEAAVFSVAPPGVENTSELRP
ncbi:secretin and TonB N-terminal domain-containing protein [Rhodocyclus gracilis]